MTNFIIYNTNSSERNKAEIILERLMNSKIDEMLSCAKLAGYSDFDNDLKYLLYIYDLSEEVFGLLTFRDLYVMVSNVNNGYFDENVVVGNITADEYHQAVIYRLALLLNAAAKYHQMAGIFMTQPGHVAFMIGLLHDSRGVKYVDEMMERYKDFRDSDREPDPEDTYPYDYDPLGDNPDPRHF